MKEPGNRSEIAETGHAPRVSVIIPTYNRADLLLEALESVRQQTVPPAQVVVVDDASSDDTLSRLRSLDLDGLEVLSHPHCGRPGTLRNYAAARATGDYLAFLDSDDLWLEKKLERQLEVLERFPDASWSITQFFKTHGRTREVEVEIGQEIGLPAEELAARLMSHRHAIVTPSVLLRRDVFEELAGFDETLRFGEDYDLWLRLCRTGACAGVAERLTHVRHFREDHYPSPAEEVHRSWVRILDKHRRDESRRLRRVASRNSRHHQLQLARLCAAQRRWGGTARALFHATASLLGR